MINKKLSKKVLLRRFKEIFYKSNNSYLKEESFNYFIDRIADFYEYLNKTHPEFIATQNRQTTMMDVTFAKDLQEIDEYFKYIIPIIKKLSINKKFQEIINTGRSEFENHINRGAYTPSSYNIIYTAYDFKIKILIDPIFSTKKTSLDEASEIVFSFERIMYELDSSFNDIKPGNTKMILRKCNSVRQLLDSIKSRVSRVLDYNRISSFQKVQQIWKHVYSDSSGDNIGLTLSFAKNNDNLKREIIDSLVVDTKRMLNSVYDWIDSQSFIDEALLDFKMWAELVNDKQIEKLLRPKNRKVEERLKDEFSRFMFSTYKILCLREVVAGKMRPDSFFKNEENNILGEAKFIENGATNFQLESIILQGLQQISAYTTIRDFVNSYVLILFNFSETKISNSVLESVFKEKPIFFLPLNICSKPSTKSQFNFDKRRFNSLIKKV